MLAKNDAKNRIKKLKEQIWEADNAYFVLDSPIMSDAARDSLKDELEKLEIEFPEFITTDSPTQRIGGKAIGKFEKIKHNIPKYSLDDVFSFEEVVDFDERVKRFLNLPTQNEIEYSAELKIDGLNITFIYKNGIFEKAITRGDGIIGEDVTHTVKTIKTVPLKLKEQIDIEVGGEIYMPIKSLEKINMEAKKNNGQIFANPRNAAAGTVRQLDPKIASERDLQAYFYAISLPTFAPNQPINAPAGKLYNLKTQLELLEYLKNLGFRVEPHYKKISGINESKNFFEEIEKIRNKLSFEIDGIVIKVNDLESQEKLGRTAKHVRWASAYKFQAKQATTIVEDIFTQVGRTGIITPVALLRPVKVAGSTVSRATLHNEDEIKRLDIRIGDTVIIQKAGDVIPDIISVLIKMRNGKEKKFSMPEKCPVCFSRIERRPGEAGHYCVNKNCFAKQKEKIYHFVSRGCFDISGLGPKIIDKLLDEGLIEDESDIFALKQGDLEEVERLGEKSAENLISAIENKKNISLEKFINALGIRHVGEEMAGLLANFVSEKKLNTENFIKIMESISIDDLNKINGIGEVVAESIYDYFHNEKNIKFIEKMFANGVAIETSEKRKETRNEKLKNKTFVLTGTLSTMSRDKAKEKIRSFGGKISSSVSKNTDFVVAGENPGSKLADAEKFGIKILDEEGFNKII
jgi:DNA ligase (NAD+)